MIDFRYMRVQEVLGQYFDQGVNGAGKPYSELRAGLIRGGYCRPISETIPEPILYPFNPSRFLEHVYQCAGETIKIRDDYRRDYSIAYWVGYVYTAIYACACGKYTLEDVVQRIDPEQIAKAFYPLHEASDSKIYRTFMGEDPPEIV